jgi:murein DD-endopeptidase MepM/ murein hydrolase activator NlpD
MNLPVSSTLAACRLPVAAILFSLLAACAGPENTDDKPALAAAPYTVASGDTLSSIARRSGQSVGALAALNQLSDAGDIKVGQVLQIGPRSAQRGKHRAAAVTGTARSANNPEITNPAAAGPAPRNWAHPTDGPVTVGFEQRKKGIEIAGSSGQEVRAANDGKVSFVGGGIRGYGNLVIIQHSGNLLSVYAHNKTIAVKEGQSVRKGQKIAEMGNSDSRTVKLYFEIRQNGKPVDPANFLPGGSGN